MVVLDSGRFDGFKLFPAPGDQDMTYAGNKERQAQRGLIDLQAAVRHFKILKTRIILISKSIYTAKQHFIHVKSAEGNLGLEL